MMYKKLLVLFMMVFYSLGGFAQSEVNHYKYVIIPRTYDFLKVPDKYQLNSLTKFLFKKYGFEAYWEDEDHPADLIADPCLGLNADVINESSLFTSKLLVKLTNCSQKVVFISVMGKSKEKDFKKSYQQALRKAFGSIQRLNYHYVPGNSVAASAIADSAVKTTNIPEESKEVSQQQMRVTKPVVEKQNTSVAIPAAVAKVEINQKVNEPANNMARSYRGERISFFLIATGKGFTAYVNDSKDSDYKKGEMIGTLLKTSLPNVYRITWKSKGNRFEDTTGYFDDQGNLNIDFKENDEIKVKVFKVEN